MQEAIFKQSLHSKGAFDFTNYLPHRWSLTTSLPTYSDRIPCYVCQQWNYTQLLFERSGRGFEPFENKEFCEFLQKACKLNQTDASKDLPLLISSLTDWLPVPLLDCRVYAQILKGKDGDVF